MYSIALWLAGCVPQVTSEEGQVTAQASDLKIIGSGQQTAPLLEGTVTCPTLSCIGACPLYADPIECFDLGTSGAVQLDGACWQFQGPGEATVALSSVPCAANDEGYLPIDDRFVFEVVSAEEIEVRPTDLEALAESALSPGPLPAFPADWRQPEGEPWQIVENQPFTFFPILWRGGEEVGWTLAQGSGSAPGFSGTAPLVTNAPGAVTVELDEGSAADLALQVGASSWPLAQVVGVADTAPASLEVVVAYFSDPLSDTSSPAGARAIVRDADGQLVWGSAVTWTLDEGLLALGDPSIALPGSDYLSVMDQCVLPSANGGEHTAVLRATLGALTATAELQWTVAAGLSDEGFVPSAYCVGGPQTPTDTGAPTDTGTPTDTDGTGNTDDTDNTDAVVDTDDTGAPVTDASKDDAEGGGCGCATGGDRRWLGALLALAAGLARSRRSR